MRHGILGIRITNARGMVSWLSSFCPEMAMTPDVNVWAYGIRNWSLLLMASFVFAGRNRISAAMTMTTFRCVLRRTAHVRTVARRAVER